MATQECVLACIVNIEQWSKQAGISGSLLNFAVTDGIHVIAYVAWRSHSARNTQRLLCGRLGLRCACSMCTDSTRFVDNDRPAASLYFTSGSEWIEDPVGSGQFHMVQVRTRRPPNTTCGDVCDRCIFLSAARSPRARGDDCIRTAQFHVRRLAGGAT